MFQSNNANVSIIYSTNALNQLVPTGLITWTTPAGLTSGIQSTNLGTNLGTISNGIGTSSVGFIQAIPSNSINNGLGLGNSVFGGINTGIASGINTGSSIATPVILSNTAIPNAITVNPLGQVFANGQFAGIVRSLA